MRRGITLMLLTFLTLLSFFTPWFVTSQFLLFSSHFSLRNFLQRWEFYFWRNKEWILQGQHRKYPTLHIHCLWRQSLHLRDPCKASFIPFNQSSLDSACEFLSTNISLNLFLPCSHALCTWWGNTDWCTPFYFWASETWVESKCCWRQLQNTTFLTWCSKGMMQLCSPCSSHLFFVVFLSFGNIANKAKIYIYILFMCVSILVASCKILMWIWWTAKWTTAIISEL